MKFTRWHMTVGFVFLLLLLSFAAGWFLFRRNLLYHLFEDRYIEWAQFFCLAFSSVLSLLVAKALWRTEPRKRFFYVLVGLFCAAVAAEEISWGQRIFGFETPEIFIENNEQGETDFHNWLSRYLSEIIAYNNLLALCAIFYGVVLPLVCPGSARCRQIVERLGIEIPPKVLILGFLPGAIALFSFFDMEEEGELLIYLAVLFMVVIKRNESKAAHAQDQEPADPARAILVTSTLVGICSVVSTALSDSRGDRFVPHYHLTYGAEFARHGFFKDAVRQFDKALDTETETHGYRITEHLEEAIIGPRQKQVSLETAGVDGDWRIVLVQNPPETLTCRLKIPNSSALKFGVALDDESWDDESGIRVRFEIRVKDGAQEAQLFSRLLDPAEKDADHEWRDETVDLSAYGGKEIEISFSTKVEGRDLPVSAMWSDPGIFPN